MPIQGVAGFQRNRPPHERSRPRHQVSPKPVADLISELPEATPSPDGPLPSDPPIDLLWRRPRAEPRPSRAPKSHPPPHWQQHLLSRLGPRPPTESAAAPRMGLVPMFPSPTGEVTRIAEASPGGACALRKKQASRAGGCEKERETLARLVCSSASGRGCESLAFAPPRARGASPGCYNACLLHAPNIGRGSAEIAETLAPSRSPLAANPGPIPPKVPPDCSIPSQT